jgi:hypothetical protein
MAADHKHRRGSSNYILGRTAFAKIGEIEGIEPSRELEETFRDFDRQRLSPAERRHRLARKYAPKA